MKDKRNKISHWITQFYIYNLLFFFLQFILIFFKGQSFVQAIPLPSVVILELLLTLFIQLFLYLLLSIFQAGLMWGIQQRFNRSYYLFKADGWHMFIWLISTLCLLSANGYLFPLSAFSKLFLPELPIIIVQFIMSLCLIILALLFINTFSVLPKRVALSLIFFSVFVFLSAFYFAKFIPKPVPTYKKPNIIIIGIDSLSPSNIKPNSTPFIANFIQNSTVFSNAISPLAHTLPSWASILTGLYPHHHGATYNLISHQHIKKELSLAWTLNQLGYTTLYATDDRRFNSINEEFGFKRIIGPQKGVNDIILGSYNDFPLSNLIINLPFSKWLFPYNYTNRASYFSYYPQTFDLELKNSLLKEKQGPFFIAVHFALPHWPYAWAMTSPAQLEDPFNVDGHAEIYKAALLEVDKQVEGFFYFLDKNNYLFNSLVILLSDHGESFYFPGSRQTSSTTYQGEDTSILADYFKRKTSTALNMSVGHGSDLLSTDQYHCLLAIRIYRDGKLSSFAKKIQQRVSLIDILPTIQTFLGLSHTKNLDGISLFNAIVKQEHLPSRSFIMESGMLPNQFLSEEKARILGRQFFEITRQGDLTLREDQLAILDALKLYATIKDDWLFALYPDDYGYIPVILNLKNNFWTDSLTTSFAQESPAISMLFLLNQFYSKKWILQNSIHSLKN